MDGGDVTLPESPSKQTLHGGPAAVAGGRAARAGTCLFRKPLASGMAEFRCLGWVFFNVVFLHVLCCYIF